MMYGKDLSMASKTIVLETQLPEDVYLTLRARGLFRQALAEESRRLLALRYYQDRILSLGKAARLAGMSRWRFIEFLSDNDVPVVDYNDEELAGEFAAVDELETELRR
jgi:predicted HTH domain antitoxin